MKDRKSSSLVIPFCATGIIDNRTHLHYTFIIQIAYCLENFERNGKMASLTEDFIKEVERRILTGQWEIGMKLPPSRELAEEFLVSRSVINAGIAELCSNGYLNTVPRRHIYVSDWRRTGTFAMLSSLIDNGFYDIHVSDDLFEGRMTIETAIARKAAKARTDEDIIQMNSIIAKEKRCSTPEDRAEADKAFHHAIAAASHNLVYVAMLNAFSVVEDKMVQEFYEQEIDYEFVIAMHERVLEAIKREHPTEAEEHMRTLLTHGENEIKN